MVGALLALGPTPACFDPSLDRQGGVDGAPSATDAPPSPSVQPSVTLTWQIAKVAESGPQRGAPAIALDYEPIVPPPLVRIATLAGEFGVDTTTYHPSGEISIPESYVNQPWRLEYTLTDAIPHEVQWDPIERDGWLTVPLFGRADRDAVPVGGGYTITPNVAADHAYRFPRILTTGLWTEGFVASLPDGPDNRTLDYDFASARSLSGAKGRLYDARGDRAILVDYEVDNSGCRVARGAAEFSPDLTPNIHSAVSPSWATTARAISVSSFGADGSDERIEHLARITATLGKLGGPTVTGEIVVGRAASMAMPALTQPATTRLLPSPMMHTLVSCPYLIDQLPSVLHPAAFSQFPLLVHIQITSTRSVRPGIGLSSGMETVLASNSETPSFDVAFPAAIPTGIKLATPSLGEVDLAGESDEIPVGSPSGTFTLSFVPEASAFASNDYYDVYLHRIDGVAHVTERIYTTTKPSVRIDGAVLVAGAEYVFQIRSYKGHPMAAQGDFRLLTYPYGSAVVFTRTIVIN